MLTARICPTLVHYSCPLDLVIAVKFTPRKSEKLNNYTQDTHPGCRCWASGLMNHDSACDRSFCVPTAVVDRTMRRRTYFCDRKLVICTPLLSMSDDDDEVFFTYFTLSQPTTMEWYTPMRVMIVFSREVVVLPLNPFFLFVISTMYVCDQWRRTTIIITVHHTVFIGWMKYNGEARNTYVCVCVCIYFIVSVFDRFVFVLLMHDFLSVAICK